MFLKTIRIEVVDDCPIHGEEAWHIYEFVRYDAFNHKVIIRLRCQYCVDVGFDDWEYFKVTPEYWKDFIFQNDVQDFIGAS